MSKAKVGVIVAQVGTPEDTSIPGLRRYLKAFLSDERIMDLPRWYWLPILHGLVLPHRPRQIAHHYKDIWTKKGSPLLVHSLAQVKGLQEKLGCDFQVELGLAYSKPSMKQAMQKLEAAGITRIVVLPMFPQFSTTTTASIYDEVMFYALGRERRTGKPIKKYVPSLRFIAPYFDDPDYISMLGRDVAGKLKALPHKPDTILISFHGIPKRYVDEGDPYPEHCRTTADLLAHELGWGDSDYQMTYQSRFGREEWLQPYTQTVLPALAEKGVKRVAIVSPGFTTDCLETIHELGIEGAELFAEGGGRADQVYHISCLNSSPAWVEYMNRLVRNNAQGW